MPTPTEIRDAIKTTIETVAGRGPVHTSQQFGVEEGIVRRAFDDTDTSTLRGWQIMLADVTTENVNTGLDDVISGWTIEGFWQAETPADELEFDLIVDAIRLAFRTDTTLGNVVAATQIEGSAGLQINRSRIITFAGALCHLAGCTLQTRHTEAV